jgi:hypothetical protein
MSTEGFFMILKMEDLQEAAIDFHYLLNRGYPRKTSLEIVGNRYNLSFDQRHLLHRGIYSDSDAKARRKKKVPLQKLRDKKIAIDGHNVLITIEAALSGRPLILSNDGFIRDISGLSGNFKMTDISGKAIHLILDALKKTKPFHVLFLFDAPISKSGLLAYEVREQLRNDDLPGDAMAVKVPEKILLGFKGIVATSDTAIIDQSIEVFDLAGHIVMARIKPPSLLRLKTE